MSPQLYFAYAIENKKFMIIKTSGWTCAILWDLIKCAKIVESKSSYVCANGCDEVLGHHVI